MKAHSGKGTSPLCLPPYICTEPFPQATSASPSSSGRPSIPAALAPSQLQTLRGWGSFGDEASSGNVLDLYQRVLA